MLKHLSRYLITLIATGMAIEALAAPQAQLVVSRTTGVAPLAIHFDATGTTDTNGGVNAFRELEYDFHFDDPNAGVWAHSNMSKNRQVGGPLTGHVFDQPGEYDVSLTVRDGNGGSSNTTVRITVQDPDTVFSGTDTVCISRTTNMTGCPSGAQRLTNPSSWPTFVSNKRYLLRAGQDFRSLGDIQVGQISTATISSFGSGDRPVTDKVNLQSASPNWGANWINDVRVAGLSAGGITLTITGSEILIYDNDIHATNASIYLASSYNWYKQGGYYESILRTPKNLFVVDNTNLVSGGRAFGLGQMVWMGNHFDNSWQHNIRLWQVWKTVVAHNRLEGGSVEPGRSNLKVHSAGLDTVTIDGIVPRNEAAASRYLVVANNIFNSEDDSGVWNTVAYAPQNNSSSEGCEDAILENNMHIRCQWSGHWQTGLFGGRNITQRGDRVQNSSTGDTINSQTSRDISALPSSWDGPYYISDADPQAAVSPPMPPTIAD